MTAQLAARVERGALVFVDACAVTAALSAHEGQAVRVSVDRASTRRSLRANRYWWGVIVPMFQEIWSRGRAAADLPPYDKDQVHTVLVEAIAGFEDGPLPGTRVRLSTRTLDSKQFAWLIDRARELALHDYQVHIPEPGESVEEP